jgi:signal peptidase
VGTLSFELETPAAVDAHCLDKLTRTSKTPLRLLTKGDNNLADDTELYAQGQSFLNRKEDVIGSVVGFIPFVGYVTILLSEHPWLKQVMLGIMGVMVVLQRE